MTLYHITPFKNLKNIKKYGLLMNYFKIFLTGSVENAKWWRKILVEDNYQKNYNKWVILEINLNKKDLWNIMYCENKILQCRYEENIDFENIKIKEVIK